MSEPLPRLHARAIFQAAIDAVTPESAVRRWFATHGAGLDAFSRVFVIGGGKAGAGMVGAIEALLAHRLESVTGFVNVPDDLVRSTRAIRLHPSRPTGSNLPTLAAESGVRQMLALADQAGPNDAVIVLLSGGGSALLPAPVDGVSLADKIAATKRLASAGADITQLNVVRKHLSRFKGGRLAARLHRAGAVIGLVISDVVGDPLDVIASGPTVADPSTFADAVQIVQRFGLAEKLPASVRTVLEMGLAGQLADTPKTTPVNVQNFVIANNAMALEAAASQARQLGYCVTNLGSDCVGDTTEVARDLAKRLDQFLRPHCVVLGGETTVRLSEKPGQGGRNQEFVLALAMSVFGRHTATFLSGGTDGEDGNTSAAGAICDDAIYEQGLAYGDPAEALRGNNCYPWWQAAGGLIETGLTGTNVMDVRIVLLPESLDQKII